MPECHLSRSFRSAARFGLLTCRPTRPRKGDARSWSFRATGNRHERASTVLVVPLTTSIHKDVATHVFLSARETGLQSDSAARAEDIVTVHKEGLAEPQGRLRQLSDSRVCELNTAS